MAGLSKPQKQILLANGFLAGLAELGVQRIPADNLGFELPFMQAWRRWSRSGDTSAMPMIEYGSASQPRDILFRVQSSTSPFKRFAAEGITDTPYGLSPREFLEIHCDKLPVDVWLELAGLFVDAVRGTREAEAFTCAPKLPHKNTSEPVTPQT